MDDLNATITSGLTEHYTKLANRVRELAAPLTEEQFWQKPFPFGNSFGHLVLHLTGNLNYYIGAQMARTGYIRDRDREFTETKHPRKEEALQRFDAAVNVVLETLRAQSSKDWLEPYTAVGAQDAHNRFDIAFQCATHLRHHIGQMNYLCFELNRQEKPGTASSSR